MLLLLLLLVSESVGTVVILLYREPALHHVQVHFVVVFVLMTIEQVYLLFSLFLVWYFSCFGSSSEYLFTDY